MQNITARLPFRFRVWILNFTAHTIYIHCWENLRALRWGQVFRVKIKFRRAAKWNIVQIEWCTCACCTTCRRCVSQSGHAFSLKFCTLFKDTLWKNCKTSAQYIFIIKKWKLCAVWLQVSVKPISYSTKRPPGPICWRN